MTDRWEGTDRHLTERPGKGWTRWADGTGAYTIEETWWQSKMLHFPKLNVTCWFDGSELVGIEHWGYREQQWTMRKQPADWQPMPAGYRTEAERAWLAYRSHILHEEHHAALLRCRKWPRDPLPRWCWGEISK